MLSGLYLIILVATAAIVSAGQVSTQAQCGIIGEAEYCEKTLCYITLLNTTCDSGQSNITEAPAPDCDTVYYVSFVAAFGDSYFTLYESPEAEANGYDSQRAALDYVGSVKPLTPCTLVNGTAYSSVSKSNSGGSSNSKYSSAILGIVIAAVALLAVLIVCVIVLIVAVAIVFVYRAHKKSSEMHSL